MDLRGSLLVIPPPPKEENQKMEPDVKLGKRERSKFEDDTK